MTLLDGVLRAVAAERPATRLILEGPAPAVRAIWCCRWRKHCTLAVPTHSLAADALRLADGTTPAPRRQRRAGAAA